MELEVYEGPADYSLDETPFYDAIIPYFYSNFPSSMTTTSNGFNGKSIVIDKLNLGDQNDFRKKKNRKKSVSFLPNLVQVSVFIE
jgi:hypothetical protein